VGDSKSLCESLLREVIHRPIGFDLIFHRHRPLPLRVRVSY
jgi:hypothetical protein